MTTFPRAFFLVLLFSVPALAQSTPYSFDNFDTLNGVRVYEPTSPRAPSKGTQGTSKSASSNKGRSNKTGPALTSPTEPSRPLLQPTTLVYEPTSTVLSSQGSALRGYTTGSAQIDGYIINAGTNNGVDPLLLYSVMHQESSFESGAISPKGARGLMQLMPGTAARYGVTNIFDPRQNINGGARYLRFLLDRYDGDVNLALAGYNAGEGAVDKYGCRIPPYAETQEYVRRISRRYGLLRDPNSALFASRLSSNQLAGLGKQSAPLNVYERTVLTVRLPDGRLQLMNQ